MLSVFVQSVVMPSVFMLSVIVQSVAMLSVVYAECHYAECRYVVCRYAECRGADYLALGIVYDKSGVPAVLIRQLVTNKPSPPSDASGNNLECFILTNGFVG